MIGSKDEFDITDDVFYVRPHLATLLSWAPEVRSGYPLLTTRLPNNPPW
jgi:hypothetical protein